MAPELNTTTLSPTQTTTRDPQSAVGSGVGGAQTGSVQSGTPADLLRGQSGIPLSSTPLSAVSLGASSTATTAAPSRPPKHHVNGVLLGFSGLLILIAVAMFIAASRSVKSTT